MHALPLNRNQIFFTNALAGLILLLLPLIILCLILLIPARLPIYGQTDMYASFRHVFAPVEIYPNGIPEGGIVNSFPVVAAFFFRTALAIIFYYSLYLLSASLSGNTVITAIIATLINLLPIGVYLFGYMIAYFYIFGYDSYNSMKSLAVIFRFVNPVAMPMAFHSIPMGDTAQLETQNYYTNSYDNVSSIPIVVYTLVHIIIAVVVIFFAFYCNRQRRNERAGDSVVFKPVKNTFVFIGSFAGMFVVAIFCLSMFGSVVAMYIGALVGFCLSYFIAQMIAERTFNIFDKAKLLIKYGCVALGIILAAILIARTDLTGYERRIPKVEDIEGVVLQGVGSYLNNEISELNDARLIKDTDTVNLTWSFHNNIIEQRGYLYKDHLNYIEQTNSRGNRESTVRVAQSILYVLKNGDTIYRNYFIPYEFAKLNGYNELNDKEDSILSQYPSFQRLDLIKYLLIEQLQYDNKLYEVFNITNRRHIAEFIQLLKTQIVSEARRINETTYLEYEKILAGTVSIEATKPDTAVGYQIRDYLYGYVAIPRTTANLTGDIYRTDNFSIETLDTILPWLEKNGYLREVEADKGITQ
jgi:ABC-2 type transport system permease protein